jgi:hypothetical protein
MQCVQGQHLGEGDGGATLAALIGSRKRDKILP